MKFTDEEISFAMSQLKSKLVENQIIYTLQTKSKSGITRRVRVFIAVEGRKIQEITCMVGKVIGYTYNPDTEIIMSGGGYNAGLEIVTELAKVFRLTLNHREL